MAGPVDTPLLATWGAQTNGFLLFLATPCRKNGTDPDLLRQPWATPRGLCVRFRVPWPYFNPRMQKITQDRVYLGTSGRFLKINRPITPPLGDFFGQGWRVVWTFQGSFPTFKDHHMTHFNPLVVSFIGLDA